MTAASFAQHMVNGISLGSLYALIAIGYTMVYGILLMINFAHADIVMMACYFAFFGITAFHIPWYLTFIGTIIATALLGVTIERTAYRPLRDALPLLARGNRVLWVVGLGIAREAALRPGAEGVRLTAREE